MAQAYPEFQQRNVELVAISVDDRTYAFQMADLVGAEFPGTSFKGASLRSAYFGGVALIDADLSGADLGEVRNLTPEQLEAARVDERTILPPALAPGNGEARAAG